VKNKWARERNQGGKMREEKVQRGTSYSTKKKGPKKKKEQKNPQRITRADRTLKLRKRDVEADDW